MPTACVSHWLNNHELTHLLQRLISHLSRGRTMLNKIKLCVPEAARWHGLKLNQSAWDTVLLEKLRAISIMRTFLKRWRNRTTRQSGAVFVPTVFPSKSKVFHSVIGTTDLHWNRQCLAWWVVPLQDFSEYHRQLLVKALEFKGSEDGSEAVPLWFALEQVPLQLIHRVWVNFEWFGDAS